MLLDELALCFCVCFCALIYIAVGVTVAMLLPERHMRGGYFTIVVFWPLFVATILIALIIKKIKEGITNVIKKRMP